METGLRSKSNNSENKIKVKNNTNNKVKRDGMSCFQYYRSSCREVF